MSEKDATPQEQQKPFKTTTNADNKNTTNDHTTPQNSSSSSSKKQQQQPQQQQQQLTPLSIPDPQSMTLVQSQYDTLLSTISTLGSSISTLLSKQERDFLSAYRAHMQNVQKDFYSMRSEVEAKEEALRQNVVVRQLERERDWYRKEALHLDKVVGKSVKREGELREELEEVREDRDWVRGRLREVMRE
eukprot:CAMPEP_0172502530 /NCGR_PEP_ID=MMETSP1066-20121228/160969_1 /TAXON_ID=671091 /ORGANISM="Coscinodiscus wailesii, Strain CCMP2513" /LENGTH=188 /DNA_ID=CAMNT_0013277829 /DNA_START=121 /DNA_END=684 /DNA_ORIENTATION=-